MNTLDTATAMNRGLAWFQVSIPLHKPVPLTYMQCPAYDSSPRQMNPRTPSAKCFWYGSGPLSEPPDFLLALLALRLLLACTQAHSIPNQDAHLWLATQSIHEIVNVDLRQEISQ